MSARLRELYKKLACGKVLCAYCGKECGIDVVQTTCRHLNISHPDVPYFSGEYQVAARECNIESDEEREIYKEIPEEAYHEWYVSLLDVDMGVEYLLSLPMFDRRV